MQLGLVQPWVGQPPALSPLLQKFGFTGFMNTCFTESKHEFQDLEHGRRSCARWGYVTVVQNKSVDDLDATDGRAPDAPARLKMDQSAVRPVPNRGAKV